jgi:hypothetical protein
MDLVQACPAPFENYGLDPLYRPSIFLPDRPWLLRQGDSAYTLVCLIVDGVGWNAILAGIFMQKNGGSEGEVGQR